MSVRIRPGAPQDMKYRVKYELGPTAADCYEQVFEAESETQAGLKLWQWMLENNPSQLSRIMVTAYEIVV